MRILRRNMLYSLLASAGVGANLSATHAHPHFPRPGAGSSSSPATARTAIADRAPGVSGQGEMKFHVLYTSDRLPPEARKVLVNAHGGFAVDRRTGKEETYFALPGAGILQISSDLKTIGLIDTPDEMRNLNLHDTTIWYDPDGTPYLTFPANDAGKIFTTTLDGKLVNTLEAPTATVDFEHLEIRDYFLGGGNFAPTAVEFLNDLYYVTTGYCNLDYVLTARINRENRFEVVWNDLAFGGKGEGVGQFGTAHGITIPPGKVRLDIADRPHSRLDRFTRYGHYLSTLKTPSGSLPCDINYLDQHYSVVPALDGPDKKKGAPIYILKDEKLISTIMPKEDLGLENFVHIHNAALRRINGRFYILAQAWNPGDFAIFEQATA